MKTADQKQDEVWIMESLKEHGYADIKFGPDPPDLIYNQDISIEVTRITEQVLQGGKYVSTDTLQNGFRQAFQEIIDEFPNEENLDSAIVHYTFYRPIPKTLVNKKRIREILQQHLLLIGQEEEYEIDKIQIRIDPSSEPLKKRYSLGFMNEGGPGALQPAFTGDNLKISMADKEEKLLKYKSLYKESWLAFLDCTGFGISDQNMDELKTYLKLKSDFDKILIFSPFHHFKFNTLYTKS
jgi:hypothetical protein